MILGAAEVIFHQAEQPSVWLSLVRLARNPPWSVVVPRSKLIYAVGWYNAQHNLLNATKRDPHLGSSPSFCSTVPLAAYPGVVKRLDPSGTWVFDRLDPNGTGFRVWFGTRIHQWCLLLVSGSPFASTSGACAATALAVHSLGPSPWCRFDDEVSFGPKYAAVRAAGWGGVGVWLASGMFPNGIHVTKPHVFGPAARPALPLSCGHHPLLPS